MRKFLPKILILIVIFSPAFTISQENLRLTITPPLIKVSFNPGQIWQSSIKVVNNNPQNLNVFVSVMDFKSGPEGGIIFIREATEKEKKFLLSQWIEFPEEIISIPAFQSKEIPFTIRVPQDAEPGGKYAAILVGTKPPEETSGTAIRITPLVSSLILANVRGEIKEAILIREFSTEKSFYQEPKVNFTLKIENIGNVHIQPKGEIKILNMYGKERGKISFNQNTEYGNILPQSSRKWNFSWEDQKNSFDVGRFEAILTINYGNEITQTETKKIHFWIIPIMPLMTILGTIFIFFVCMFLIIRFYVKRVVYLTVSRVKEQTSKKREFLVLSPKASEKVLDIKRVKPKELEKELKIPIFLRKEVFFPLLSMLILSALIISIYLINGLKEKKEFKIETLTEKEKISPENILEKLEEEKIEIEKKETLAPKQEVDKNSFFIYILNGTGTKGLAKKIAEKLEKEGFRVEKIGNADSFNYRETLIRYKKGKEKEAQFLNNFFGEKFKLIEIENQKEDIILIIGADFQV